MSKCRQECRPFVNGVLTTTASVIAIAITTSKKANNKQGQLGKMQLYGKCFWIWFLYTLFTFLVLVKLGKLISALVICMLYRLLQW